MTLPISSPDDKEERAPGKLWRSFPRWIRFILVVVAINMCFFAAFRLLFWVLFRGSTSEPKTGELIQAFYLGLKFDLRLSLLVCLPPVLLGWIPWLDVLRSRGGKVIWLIYFVGMGAFLAFVYFVDLGHYSYLHERLNAQAVDHLLAPKIALRMIWETYPVIPGVLALILISGGYGWAVNRLALRELKKRGRMEASWAKAAMVMIALILYAGGIYGKLAWYPLRWSEAYFSENPFVSALALNPILFFFDTRQFRERSFDERAVREHYGLISRILQVDHPDTEKLSFERHVKPERSWPGPPNIVLILLESFAGFKVGALGNRLDPTPHFDAIAEKSLFFTNFFVTQPPTARAVFTVMFGIPDVHAPHSASRNPLIVRQYTLVNALEGYEKMYFIGGSANWGNVRGIMAHNIPGLKIYEEGDFSSPRQDVWGISDLHLFEEANRVLRAQEKPFFAFIHTAGNHRPYTIPKDRRDFQERHVEPEELAANGFDSLAAYNGMRFEDYSLGHFIKLASREDYFRRTIFCLFGDHGTVATRQIPWDRLALTSYHVPFVIYAPGYISEGRRIESTTSLVDVLPTVLCLAGVPHVNKTLGRDALADRPKEHRFAFIKRGDFIGLLNDDLFLCIPREGQQRLYRYRSDSPLEDVREKHPGEAAEMARLCVAIHETAKYMLYHNAPEGTPSPARGKAHMR